MAKLPEIYGLSSIQSILQKNPELNTPEHINYYLGEAAYKNLFESLKYLVEEKGADVNSKRKDNGGPIATKACGLGRTACFKYLVEKGADVNEIDAFFANRKGLLGVAIESGIPDMINYVIELRGLPEGEKLQDLILEAAYDIPALQALHAKGAKVLREEKKKQPIHHSMFRPKPQAIKLLIEMGSDVNATDGGLNTPLHLAILHRDSSYDDRANSMEVIKILASSSNINLNARNDKQFTPIMLAEQCYIRTEVKPILEAAGADTACLAEIPNLLAEERKNSKLVTQVNSKAQTRPPPRAEADEDDEEDEEAKEEAERSKRRKLERQAQPKVTRDVQFHVSANEEDDSWMDEHGSVRGSHVATDLDELTNTAATKAKTLGAKLAGVTMQSEAGAGWMPFVVTYPESHRPNSVVSILAEALGRPVGELGDEAGEMEDDTDFGRRGAGLQYKQSLAKQKNFFQYQKLGAATIEGSSPAMYGASGYMLKNLQANCAVQSPSLDPGMTLLFIVGKDKDKAANALVGVFTYSVWT